MSEVETTPSALSGNPAAAAARTGETVLDARFGTGGCALEEAVEYVLSDCFLAVGQSIGMRATVDYDAIVWWHGHFRTKFLAAMRRHGDRWLQESGGCDRGRVDAGAACRATCRRPGFDSHRGGASSGCRRPAVLHSPIGTGRASARHRRRRRGRSTAGRRLVSSHPILVDCL